MPTVVEPQLAAHPLAADRVEQHLGAELLARLEPRLDQAIGPLVRGRRTCPPCSDSAASTSSIDSTFSPKRSVMPFWRMKYWKQPAIS